MNIYSQSRPGEYKNLHFIIFLDKSRKEDWFERKLKENCVSRNLHSLFLEGEEKHLALRMLEYKNSNLRLSRRCVC